jgi:hypothetical protein
MLDAKDTELLAALRKTALLTEELKTLRQQQQQQGPLGITHTAQQQQGRVSSSSAAAFNAAGGMGSEGLGAALQGADEGGSTPRRQDGGHMGLTAAAYCSQQLLTGLTASEPGDVLCLFKPY